MTSQVFSKEVITHKFSVDILKFSDDGITQELKEELWRAYLNLMASNKLIGEHSAKTWTYPKDLK
jgi:hypothetical protein